jgi:hypothetical protein
VKNIAMVEHTNIVELGLIIFEVVDIIRRGKFNIIVMAIFNTIIMEQLDMLTLFEVSIVVKFVEVIIVGIAMVISKIGIIM